MVARSLAWFRQQAPDRGPGLTSDHAAPGRAERADRARSTVMQGDRAKAYRPISPARRRAALKQAVGVRARRLLRGARVAGAGLDGDVGPGRAGAVPGLDQAGRRLRSCGSRQSGGMVRNLQGARSAPSDVAATRPDVGTRTGIDVPALVAAIGERLAALAGLADALAGAPAPIHDLLPAAPSIR